MHPSVHSRIFWLACPHRFRFSSVRRADGRVGSGDFSNFGGQLADDAFRKIVEDGLTDVMNTDPDKYRHALLINLHGELAPMPAIRNYSDPAKTGAHPGLRVVTHPEELRTHRDTVAGGTDDVYLRVYAYSADPKNYYKDGEPVAPAIAVDVMDVDLRGTETTTSGRTYRPFHDEGWVRAMFGGVTVNGSKRSAVGSRPYGCMLISTTVPTC